MTFKIEDLKDPLQALCVGFLSLTLPFYITLSCMLLDLCISLEIPLLFFFKTSYQMQDAWLHRETYINFRLLGLSVAMSNILFKLLI